VTDKPDFIWGVKAIAAEIGKTDRATQWMLRSGKLPAKKIGKQWASTRTALRNRIVAGLEDA
jgi:hypothetical protein